MQLYTLDCDIAFIKTEFQKKNYAIRFEFATLEQEKASLSSDQKEILLFFLGDYENILEKAEKDQDNLGWSSNLKGNTYTIITHVSETRKDAFCG